MSRACWHGIATSSSWRWGGADRQSRRSPPCSRPSRRCSTFHSAGQHAASDYLETAALTGVVTIGCRRAGGGLAGAVTTSNVLQGAALAAEREPDVVVFDGSGAAIPPIDVDARILVSGRGHDPLAYLNAYRVLVSDLVVLVGGGDVGAIRALKKIPVLEAELRLRPISPLAGTARRGLHHRRSADRPSRCRGRERVAQPRQPCSAQRGSRTD